MENYIVINGKKAELTKEQLEKLGISPGRNNPFDRAGCHKQYFSPNCHGTITCRVDTDDYYDNVYYDNGAYLNDEKFAEQMSLKWLLNRKLEKYAWDNRAEDVEWNDRENKHYYIYYDFFDKGFQVNVSSLWKCSGVVYFSAKEVAENAIEDVIKPFMKEHPNFKR